MSSWSVYMLDAVNGQILPPQEPGLQNGQYQALLEISEAISAHRDLNELFRDLAQLPNVARPLKSLLRCGGFGIFAPEQSVR